jgi:hypothetical protein
MGGVFDSLILVPDKVKEEGQPMHLKKGISAIEDEGPRWDGNKFPLPQHDTNFLCSAAEPKARQLRKGS